MAQPVRKTVELFYDVLSPYSWIGFEVLCRYKNKWNIDLQLKPFYLAGIMKGAENRPPMMVAAKGAYMIKDIHRLRSFYSIPINQPGDVFATLMTKGSLNAQRLLTAVQEKQPSLTESVSRELWMRVWSRDEDITQPESLAEALRKAGVKEALIPELMKAREDKAVAERLKAVTNEALELGTFGAPTIVVRDSSNGRDFIFGSDRMEVLAWMLGEKWEGPLRELAASKL